MAIKRIEPGLYHGEGYKVWKRKGGWCYVLTHAGALWGPIYETIALAAAAAEREVARRKEGNDA